MRQDGQPKIQSSLVEETIQRIMGQTNNDCIFWIFTLTSSPHQPRSLVGRQGSKLRYVLIYIFLRKLCKGTKKRRWVHKADDSKSSSSKRGIQIPNFTVLDARVASALNRIIQKSHFASRSSLEGEKSLKEDRFFRGRQIAYLIYKCFRVTGTHDSIENCANLFIVSVRCDIQEFDSK